MVVYAVPFAKYPPSPPRVGDPATINERTALYLGMIVWSVAAAWAAVRAGVELGRRSVSARVRFAGSLATWLVLLAVGYRVFPSGPDAVAAMTMVWRFRLASAGGVAALWAVTGFVFGYLLSPRPSGQWRSPSTVSSAGGER